MTDDALAQAEAQVESGDLASARGIAEAILAENPMHSGAHNVLGFIAYREGRLADAMTAFVLAGDHPDAQANMAAVEEGLRRSATAAPSSSVAISCSYEDLRRGALGPGLS